MSVLEENIRELFQRLNRPLDPEPTGVEPMLEPCPGVRAVIFDVYGTLICSGVGDISLIEQHDRNHLLRDLARQYGAPLREDIADLSAEFHNLIQADHAAARERGVDFPEVDIVEIWTRFFERCAGSVPDESALRQFAVEYECRVNPVWPYPGLADLLDAIRRSGRPMGIVSNAQFYTPLMLEAFLGRPLNELGFDERLLVWSFEHRLGKPSVQLYREQARRLEQSHGLAPTQCLYVGNDMLKDIQAAGLAGFRTVLFAGDRRSLRLREDDPRCAGLRADRVVTSLSQIPRLLGR